MKMLNKLMTNAASLNPAIHIAPFLFFVSLALLSFSGCDNMKRNRQLDSAELESYEAFLNIGDSLAHTDPQLVIATARQMIDMGERIGNWNKIANAKQLAAAAYFNLEKNDSALFFLYQSKDIRDRISDDFIWYKNLNEFGKNYRNMGQLDSALHYFELANAIAEQTNNNRVKMSSANNLAMILSDKGKVAEAYNKYLVALHYAEELKDIRNTPVVLNNLALIDLSTKNYDLSKSRYFRAIELNKETNKLFDLSMNYGNLAIVYQEMQLYDSAL